MAAIDAELMRAIDLTIEAVWRRTKGQTPEQRAEAVLAAMNELLPHDTEEPG